MNTFLGLLERPRFFRGYINGYKQPAALIKFQVMNFDSAQMHHLYQSLNNFFAEYQIQFDQINSAQDLVLSTAKMIDALHRLGNIPCFSESKIEKMSADDNIFYVWVPGLYEHWFHQIMAHTMQFIMQNLTKADKSIEDKLRKLISTMQTEVLAGANNANFLAAAEMENIPWRYLAMNVFQYGWGHYSRWLDSTLTDKSAKISSSLANNKIDTSALLRRAGLPVAEQYIANTAEEAVRYANNLGYPVVIKPHNQERGTGVYPYLLSEAQIKKAFDRARKFSDQILVEKHVSGRDYRLFVMNGKLIWAVERIPAGVIGDGIHTLQELINASKRFSLNEEMTELLTDRGHKLNDIPEKGMFITVTRIANVSSGGMPVPVFDKVHPDNQLLMETAANLLRLDIAGIDFIIADIQQSWRETNAAIIEINAKPQLGRITSAHVYNQILCGLLPDKGRIPIIVIVCKNEVEEIFIHQLMTILKSEYKNPGLVMGERAYLDSSAVNQQSSAYQSAEVLLLNNQVDALVYCIHHWDDINHQGLPFDQYDHLVFFDDITSLTEQTKILQKTLISSLLNACQGYQFINQQAVKFIEPYLASTENTVILEKNLIFDEIKNKNCNHWRRTGRINII